MKTWYLDPRRNANSCPLKTAITGTSHDAEITRIEKNFRQYKNALVTIIKSMLEPAKNNVILFLRNRSVNIAKSKLEPFKNKMSRAER